MADYKKPSRFNSSRPARPFSRPESRDREMHVAQCNSCNARCEVPFRPNGKKPVYCANCFVKDDSQQSRFSAPKREYESPRAARSATVQVSEIQLTELKKQIEKMNYSIEKLIVSMEAFSNAAQLTNEIRKHIPEIATDEAPVKKVAAKKVVKKAAKK